MKNIIAFSSTHGTGKSSLCYSLTSKMKLNGYSVIVLDELARENPFPINKEANIKSQYWMIFSQILKEIVKSERYDYIICDRSVIDALIYGKILHILNDDLDKFLVNYIKTFYLTIFIPNPEKFNFQKDDGVRDLDPDFRMKVYEELKKFYNMHNIKFTELFSVYEMYTALDKEFNIILW